MKKLALTIAIVLGLGLTTFADPNQGGLFKRGGIPGEYELRDGEDPLMPTLPNHGETENQNGPIGTGIAVLAALGGAYLVAKKRREE